MRAILIFMLIFLSTENVAHNHQFVLRRITVNGVEQPLSAKPVFLKLDSYLQIEAVPLYSDSATYFFRLKNSSDQWMQCAYPVAQFQKLRGGNYQFEMKARTSTFESLPITVQINVQEAFWEKWWFWPVVGIYLLFMVGVGFYLFFLYNFRQKLRIQHIRNQIAADLHDEVGSNLSSIAIFVEVLRKKAPPDMLPLLEKIIHNSQESVSLMQDTVWTISPKNDSNEKLIERMRSFAFALLSSRGVALSFEVETDLQKVHFTMEQRKNCYLIFKEAVNNIAKHAEATKATVEISADKQRFYMLIQDNGKGFDASTLQGGNGLYNFQTRAQEAEMNVAVNSLPTKGTIVSIEMLL